MWIGALALIALTFAFISNEIGKQSAIESCEQANGEAKVEKEWFGINWHVSCEVD